MKLTRVTRCLTLPPNALGRDFVVGDLHGHRALLQAELDRLGFDGARDRLLCVGDLVDRGPDSLGTLALIDEPWFHTVLGNHELMLLNSLGYHESRVHARKSGPVEVDSWIHDALRRHGRKLERLAERVAALPLAIHVQGRVPFNVAHSDLRPIGSRQERLFKGETICVHKADLLTSLRQHVHEAQRRASAALAFGQHAVRVSETPIGTLPITYVGHSPLPHVTVHDSYVYVDQRVCGEARRGPQKAPTVLDHGQFALWLRGVATARAERAFMEDHSTPAGRPRMAFA